MTTPDLPPIVDEKAFQSVLRIEGSGQPALPGSYRWRELRKIIETYLKSARQQPTEAEHDVLREAIRVEVQSHPIFLKSTKQLREMLKDRSRPISVYHNDETAGEVADAIIALIQQKEGR
jgi:hypothetical protein